MVNYTDREIPYTRIIEHKHFETFGDDVYRLPKTVISEEYPVEWEIGMEPYYPINDDRNMKLYRKYETLAENDSDVVFGGRLAEYKYYDMHHIIENVLKLF